MNKQFPWIGTALLAAALGLGACTTQNGASQGDTASGSTTSGTSGASDTGSSTASSGTYGGTSTSSSTSSSTDTGSMSSGSGTMGGTSTSDSTMGSTSSGSASLAPEDRMFLMAAAQSDMLEKQAAQLATQKARNEEVQEFAQMIMTDHQQSSTKLMSLAQQKGVTLPTTLDAAHQAKLDQLQSASGAQFDAAFAREAGVAAHEQAVKLFEEASRSQDSQIASFAQATLPTLRQHLEEARELSRTTSSRAASAE